jgi:hypothetical protein
MTAGLSYGPSVCHRVRKVGQLREGTLTAREKHGIVLVANKWRNGHASGVIEKGDKRDRRSLESHVISNQYVSRWNKR